VISIDNEVLHVDLTADGSQLESATQSGSQDLSALDATIEKLIATMEPLNGKFGALEEALTKSGAAANVAKEQVDNVAGSTRNVGSEIERATATGGPFLGFLADAAEHSRQFSMGLDAVGLKSDATLERLLGLGQFLNGLGGALPTIAAIGAGFAAVGVAAEFLKTSVDKAAELQQAMELLGNAVKNQGGDWTHMSEVVKQFADDQERSTVFSNLEVVKSLNQLTEAGLSVKDAMTITRVAEDAAAGSGRTLQEVTLGLIEATHGRATSLAELGVLTRQEMHDGMSFDDVLARIEERMGGSAHAATETYEGALHSLSSEWDHLLQDVGTPFLGMLTDLVHHLSDTVEQVDDTTGSFKSLAPEVKEVFDDMGKLAEQISPVLSGDLSALDELLGGTATNGWGAFRDAINSTLGTIDAAVRGIGELAGAVRDIGNAMANFQLVASGTSLIDKITGHPTSWNPLGGDTVPTGGFSASQMAQEQAARAMLAADSKAQQPSTDTSDNPMVGGPLGHKGSGSPYSFSPESISAQPVTAQIKDQSDAVKALAEAFGLLPKNLQSYNQELAELNPLIQNDVAQQNALAISTYQSQQRYGEAVQEYNAGINTLRQAQQAYNSYGESLDGVTKLSADQKEHLEALRQAVQGAKQNVDDLRGAMESSKTTYEQSAAALHSVTAELQGYEALAKAAQEAINRLTTAWTEYVAQTDEKYEEDFLTFSMTNEQKVAFYRNIVDNLQVVDETSLREREEAYQKEQAAELAIYQQSEQQKVNLDKEYANDFKQFLDQESTLVGNMLSDILEKHKNLRDELRSVENQMLSDWIKLIDQMVAQWIDSKIMSLFAMLMGGGGGGGGLSMPDWGSMGSWFPGSNPAAQGGGGSMGPNATQSALAGASSYGILGALLGTQGASEVIAAISTSGGAAIGHQTSSAAAGGGSITINAPSSAGVASAAAGSQASAAASGAGGTSSLLAGTGAGSTSSRGVTSLYTGAGAMPNAWDLLSSSFGGFGGGAGGAAGAAAAIGGGPGGINAGLPAAAWGSTEDTSVYGGGFGGASAATPGGATLLSGGGGGLFGSSLGGILSSAIAGDVIGNMLHPHNMGSELGGAAGGAGAFIGMEALMANPAFLAALGPYALPALIGAVLVGSLFGSEIGNLFGNHFNPADEPDVYQTQLWGQELADLQGSTSGDPMIANGQNFVMDSWTSSNTQGKGWNILMESFVQMFRNNQKVLPDSLRAGFPQIEALWGGAQNTADFNDSGKNGMLQIGSGERAEWTTFWGFISAYGPAIAQLMQQFTPTDLYAASLNGTTSQMGGYTPGGDPWLIHSFPDVGSSGGAGGAAPNVGPGGSKQTLVNLNIYNSFGGSLIAEDAWTRRVIQSLSQIPGFSLADLGAAAT